MSQNYSISDLFKTVSTLDRLELISFLQDILTPQEIEELALRWKIIKLLNRGVPQREISEILKCSVTTVSRGSRQLKYGFGGFQSALQRQSKNEKIVA